MEFKNFTNILFFTCTLGIFLLIFTGVMSAFGAYPTIKGGGVTGSELESLEIQRSMGQAAGLVGETQPGLTSAIGSVISIFLGFLGVIALILIIYGGYLWMTAAGSEEKVKKAKDLLKNAAIGLIIILMAYTITFFVVKQLGKL